MSQVARKTNIREINPEPTRVHHINWAKYAPLITLIVVFLGFSFASEAFLTERNLTNLSRQVSVNCILAFGMTIIILLGAIDLSVGSVLALGSVIAAVSQVYWSWNQYGILGALGSWVLLLGVCVSISSCTGFLVSRFKMPAFVASLGVFVMARGAALIVSNGGKVAPLSETYRYLGSGFLPVAASAALLGGTALYFCISFYRSRQIDRLWHAKIGASLLLTAFAAWIFLGFRGLPVPVLMTAFVFAAIYFILNKTVFGRYVYAIGGNAEASRLCGVPVQKIIFWSFSILGGLVALAAMIEGGRIDAGDPNAGNLYELDAIAAVVIGGTSLQGGIGSVQGTLLGALLIGTLNNGMSLMNVPTHYQMLIKGMIIILAVLVDVLTKAKKTT